jgi:endonuclease/exonuclease/phosphatase family metal-dependent hydrolase
LRQRRQSKNLFAKGQAAKHLDLVNRIFVALFASLVVTSAFGESTQPTKVRITTWNLEWFPNGSPHDAPRELQGQRIAAAADVLGPIHPDIILLQEVRDYDACARLGEAIAPGIYHVAICSAFREPFQSGLGKQQVAVLSKYQAQAAWAEPWKSMNGVDPPRGFAFAWFKIGSEEIGVYSVHLKSNLITHGDREAETAKNIQKREIAIAQLLTHGHDVVSTTMPSIKGIVVGGDFNTNHDQAMFAEKTLDTLTDAAYRSAFEGVSFEQRITHPGSHGFPDATFDYLFGKNVRIGKPVITQTNASDHLPVTCDVEFYPALTPDPIKPMVTPGL